MRAGLRPVLVLVLAACGQKDGDDTDTDTVADTDVADTDVAPTDDTDDTDVPACDQPDACDGCEPEGDAFTCDCVVTVADDPATCRPIRVALLDDAPDVTEEDPYSSGVLLRPLLEDATWGGAAPMFTVIDVGRRWWWRGELSEPGPGDDTGFDTDPDSDGPDDFGEPTGELLGVDNTDVVFLLEGVDYWSELRADAAAVLDAFVAAGGGLVRAEWGASYTGLEPETCPVLEYDEYIENTTPKRWTLVASTSDAAATVHADLPASFSIAASLVQTGVKTAEQTGDVEPETLITATYDDDTDVDSDAPEVPAVVYWPPVGGEHGAIVWVNHDFAYLHDPGDFEAMSEDEFATLVRNIARAAAPKP